MTKTLLNIQGSKQATAGLKALTDGDHDGAIASYNAAIAKYLAAKDVADDPDEVAEKVIENLGKAYQNLIAAHMGKDDFAGALEAFDKITPALLAEFFTPDIKEGILHNVAAASHKHGQALIASGKFAEASEALQKAVEASKGFDEAKFNLSSIYYDLGRAELKQNKFTEAKEAFQKTIELGKTSAEQSSVVLSSFALIVEADKKLVSDPSPNLEEAFKYLNTLGDDKIKAEEKNAELILVKLAMIRDLAQDTISDLSEAFNKLGLKEDGGSPQILEQIVVDQALAHNTNGYPKTCAKMLIPLQKHATLGDTVQDYLFALHPDPSTHIEGELYVLGEFKFDAAAGAGAGAE